MSKDHKVVNEVVQTVPNSVDADAASFRLLSQDASILAWGVAKTLGPGATATMASRISGFFSGTDEGPRLVLGAMPFDREADDFLFQPQAVDFGRKRKQARTAYTPSPAPKRWIVTAEPDAAAYSEAVRACLRLLSDPEDVRKVVLSRSLLLRADASIDVEALVANLETDRSVTTFLTRLPSRADTPRVLVGATPELLVSKTGGEVISHPLAGSMRRHSDPSADRNAAAALLASDKDRREHRAVIEAVLDVLAPYCSELTAPEPEALVTTATMWHLGTRVVGRLKDASTPVAELAAALHPTPAVCGLPRERAAAIIHQLEGYDRGFYAGAVGWSDERGDGSWFVSLRCAEIEGPRARLYAGAGIVPGSDPIGEADETSAKFLAMLKALGVDEQGRAAAGRAA